MHPLPLFHQQNIIDLDLPTVAVPLTQNTNNHHTDPPSKATSPPPSVPAPNPTRRNAVGADDRRTVGDALEDETETLISSSRSFSTNSSTDFNPQLEIIRESAPISHSNRIKLPKKRTTSLKRNGGRSPEWGSPAKVSVFKKLIPCKVEGKMKESFALVKRSLDPYNDFKRSMMEMIMEKEMFEEGDLEHLLQCYLSLNPRFHHGVIVEAFT
ncbi:hypothetical protein L1987_63291 [Smallanthus sonchifolius]|uniref:Uncharacterized protein n=1 Tax=Smallanthus sonchifolius TaxID=185202 RepID=A0ACB9CCU3_9ASTR|nr:hypothetical protein L1987_63291 [Smallanthus sonchifolius]